MENTAMIEPSTSPVSTMNLGSVLRIPAVRQVTLLVGIAAAVALGFAVVLWSQAPGYTRLYGDLAAADAAEVANALEAANIDYELGGDGTSILVPGSDVHRARMQLASQGLPEGAASGMDLMQDQSSFGVSQFMENARYQHALEAELARTITSLGVVRDARVHLAMPKQTAFLREQKKVSASVLLTLNRGGTLEQDQASAIVHLVASSVPDLAADNVTLIDQRGRLLSSVESPWGGARAMSRFKHSERLEESYVRRIEELLTPLVGPGRVRAQVAANLDFTVSEETRESFDPASTVVRSEQVSEEQRRGTALNAAGVPGALSNQPPETVPDGAAAAEESETAEALDTSRSSTRNYEVDRTISHIRPETGTIRRLSVAVLVDDSPLPGSGEQPAFTDADIERFRTLVREAVGFDEARGDTVVVVKAAFRDPPEPAALTEPKFWEEPGLRDTLKQVIGALIVLALGFGLVRPLLRSLVGPAPGTTQYIAGGTASMMPAGGSGAAALAGPSYDDKVTAARRITGHDPARVAQVVRKWVHDGE